MERKKQRTFIDKVTNLEVRERTKTNDNQEEITKLKWKWADVALMKDDRWTARCTEWKVRDGKRSKERQKSTTTTKNVEDMKSKNSWELATLSKNTKDRQKLKVLTEMVISELIYNVLSDIK